MRMYLKKVGIFIPKTHPVFHGTFVGFSKLTRFHQEGKEKWSNVAHLAVRMFLFLTFFPSVKLQAAKYTETRIARNGKAPQG